MEPEDEAPPPSRPRTRTHTDIQNFCWLVASGYTGTEAARQAAIRQHVDEPLPEHGIAGNRAHSLLKRQDVQDLIAKLREQIAADMQVKYGISRERIIKDLVDIQQRCMQAEPLRDGNGDPTGEWKFDSAGAINATKLLGLEIGMFAQKVKHEHSLADLSDEQLIQKARNAVLRLSAIEAAVEPAGASGADRGDPGDRGESAKALN